MRPIHLVSLPVVHASDRCKLHATWTLIGACFGEVHVDYAPFAAFLAEHHRRTRDEILVCMALARTRVATDPTQLGLAMAPGDGDVHTNDSADVVRNPLPSRHMLLVILPQLHPVIAAIVGVTVEVEEHGLGRTAPQLVAQGLPIEFRIGLKVRLLLREHLFAVACAAAD